jgi:hypothetical protein
MRRRAAPNGFLADAGKAAGEPFGIERQGEIIERAGLDRLDNAARARLHFDRDQREPDAQPAQPVKDHAHSAFFRSVARDDDAFARRVNRKLRKIAVDLAMMAQGKSHTRQFGTLAAARIDEVERGFACHAMVTAPVAYAIHARSRPIRRIYHTWAESTYRIYSII